MSEQQNTPVQAEAVVVTTEQFTESALQKYPVGLDRIEEIEKEAKALTIAGVEDGAGYKKVDKFRLAAKNKRLDVEKTRKELKAVALEYGRKIDGRAAELTEALKKIEDHCIALQKPIDDAKDEAERIRKEEEDRLRRESAAAEQKLRERTRKMFALGWVFNGETYSKNGKFLTDEKIAAVEDEKWAAWVLKQEQAIAEAEEAERLAAEAAEQVQQPEQEQTAAIEPVAAPIGHNSEPMGISLPTAAITTPVQAQPETATTRHKCQGTSGPVAYATGFNIALKLVLEMLNREQPLKRIELIEEIKALKPE